MSEFTPGPLYVFKLQDHRYLPGDHGIFQAGKGSMVGVSNKADAQLWSAAPELYEACKAALDDAKSLGDLSDDVIRLLENALDKAEGREVTA